MPDIYMSGSAPIYFSILISVNQLGVPYYYRFGQSVLQDCEYCHTYDEYALYALPRPLLEYIRETAVVGFLTIGGSRKERWRTLAIGAIVCAAVTEGYWVSTVQVKIPANGLGVVMVRELLAVYSGGVEFCLTTSSAAVA
jgi:hypothetical protein